MKYSQCVLEKSGPDGILKLVTYIPTKHAVLNNKVSLKNKETDEWQHGFVVTFVGGFITEEDLPDSHSQIKAHRKATGDALPKSKSR